MSQANDRRARSLGFHRGMTKAQNLTHGYEICADCSHSRQWHIWGPVCRSTVACQCATFVPSGRDVRDEQEPRS